MIRSACRSLGWTLSSLGVACVVARNPARDAQFVTGARIPATRRQASFQNASAEAVRQGAPPAREFPAHRTRPGRQGTAHRAAMPIHEEISHE